MILMKNSVEIKDMSALSENPSVGSDCKQKTRLRNEQKSPYRKIKIRANRALAASLAVSLSFGFVSSIGTNPAHAAGIADLFGGAETQVGQEKFLKVDQAFSVRPTQNGNTLNIALKITPKHYLYKDKLSLKLPDGVSVSALKFSHTPQTINDPSFGKVDVFKQPQVTATATLTNTTADPIKGDLIVQWQGCAEAGLCYPPQSETVAINLPASASKTTELKQKAESVTAPKQAEAAKNTTDRLKANNNESKVSTKTASDLNNQIGATSETESAKNSLSEDATDAANETLQDPALLSDGGEQEEGNEGLDPESSAEDTTLPTVEGDESLVGQQSELDANTSESDLGLGSNNVVDQDPFGLAEHPWLALLLLFLAGLGLAFTPCVLPMLPIVSNIVARQHRPTAKKGLMLSGSYALGVSIAYGILGAIIAVFGQQLGIIGWLQNPVILLAFAAIFVILALYMLDLIRIPIPNAIRQRTQSLSQAGDKYLGSTFGSFIAGLLSALVVSPCVSAPLFGALLAVSTIGNPLLGFAALFMLGFGLSAPLMLLGVSQGNLMPKAGEWMNWVKQGFALLLFAVALLLVERVLISPFMLMLWAVWFMVVAVWAWSWQGRGQILSKALAILLGSWSAITVVGAAAGSEDSWQPLTVFSQPSVLQSSAGLSSTGLATTAEQSSDKHVDTLDELIPIIKQNPKVLVDVTAEWCVECRIMDKTLFTNRPAAMQQWQLVRLDVTESNEASARILSELNLFGPPALLYFVDGKLQVQQVGTIERNEFEKTLARF